MAVPTFTMRQLLEAGVHFGHRAGRWNPKMGPYLYGVRNKVHIIDLRQTVPMLHQALVAIRDTVSSGGRVLFVGTKRQASDAVTAAADRCGQYYVNHRWLGGMMTNWHTISRSIKRLRIVEERLASESTGLTKKELLKLTRERNKLERALGGIKDMGGLPDIVFVIDTNKEEIAVKEARKLGIPLVAVVDSNSDPDGIAFPVPGNDDALRAINLYCELVSGAVLDGIQQERVAAGADAGEAAEPPAEDLSVAEEIVATAADDGAVGEAKPTETAEPQSQGEAGAAEARDEEAAGPPAEDLPVAEEKAATTAEDGAAGEAKPTETAEPQSQGEAGAAEARDEDASKKQEGA